MLATFKNFLLGGIYIHTHTHTYILRSLAEGINQGVVY